MSELQGLMAEARMLSWRNFGKKIQFYHPGMFHYDGRWGEYPAVSITGDRCELLCEHCRGKLLEPMIAATTPEKLLAHCLRIHEKGFRGALITGGSGKRGALPWDDFTDVLGQIKERTGLFLSLHSGTITREAALRLKAAGIDQALVDVVGDDRIMRDVFHLEGGVRLIEETLEALTGAGIPLVPHIIVGLRPGSLAAEIKALDMLKRYNPAAVVIVCFMPLSATPMEKSPPPAAEDVAVMLCRARLALPSVPITLGCARERGNSAIDTLAVKCGVTGIAIPSGKAIGEAEACSLEITWHRTCCSLVAQNKEEHYEERES